MTAIAVAPPRDSPSLPTQARWAVTDTLTIARRNLLVWARVPAYIVFTVVQPVIFVLMFRYVFGGAIHVPVKGGYVNFLLPGIIAQTAAFASFGTAIALAQELQKGVIDRLRSMPMARSAVLAWLVADTGRMTVTILVVVGVGYAVGFRFENGFVPAVAMIVLAIVFGISICLIAAYTGLAIGDEESVQAFGLIWLFPLTFLSSAFVPVYTMPGWLQAFANNQPVTFVVNTMRALALGGPIEGNLLEERGLAGRDLHRLRPARGPRLQARRLTGRSGRPGIPAARGPGRSVTYARAGQPASRPWPFFDSRREQAEDFSNAGRAQVRPAGGRVNPAQVSLAVKLRQRIEECARRRVSRERRASARSPRCGPSGASSAVTSWPIAIPVLIRRRKRCEPMPHRGMTAAIARGQP